MPIYEKKDDPVRRIVDDVAWKLQHRNPHARGIPLSTGEINMLRELEQDLRREQEFAERLLRPKKF